ncbi:ankyrin repeat and BTB/POZ domain-containing protein 1-like isoform X2 [Rhopilema esculentum]
MLKEFKAITSECMKRDQYHEFLRGCTDRASFEDVCFTIGEETIIAHKIILTARCPYFANKFKNKWRDRSLITLKKSLVSSAAFRNFINYLYLGRINMPLNGVSDFTAICKQCQMFDLVDEVEKAVHNFHIYVDTKPEYVRNRVSMISIGDGKDIAELQASFGRIAELCMHNSLRFKQFFGAVPEIFSICFDEDFSVEDSCLLDEEGRPPFTDVCFKIRGYEFFCHKVFLCGRSDYFKALNHFKEIEGKQRQTLLEISLKDISADAFAAVINFIYSDRCKISKDIVYELLYFADLFLLPGLKLQCAAFLVNELIPENAISVLRLARLHQLDRLESQCCEFIANYLPDIICRPEFSELVLEDASTIQSREDTDTIQVIDDIRYHLVKFALPGLCPESTDMDINGRLSLLDSVLQELNLDA